MLYTAASGVFLFHYQSDEDGPSDDDDLYKSLAEARAAALDTYGITDADWCAIDDPLPGCQHDWIAPVRAKRDASGERLWGRFERLTDSGWVDTTRPHSVGLVVEKDFGERLAALASTMHVWILSTPQNLEAARAWSRTDLGQKYSIEHGVTTFNGSRSLEDAPDEVAADILDTIYEHHGHHSHVPPWSVLVVYGTAPTPSLLKALADFGFADPKVFDGGFEIALRT